MYGSIYPFIDFYSFFLLLILIIDSILLYSILFYSILFDSILFYFIIFYSIRFFTIPYCTALAGVDYSGRFWRIFPTSQSYPVKYIQAWSYRLKIIFYGFKFFIWFRAWAEFMVTKLVNLSSHFFLCKLRKF